MFLHVSVILSTGGVSRPIPGGGVQAQAGGVSQHALRQTPQTATAAGSTHPTGMHSCSAFSLHFEAMRKEFLT